MLRRKNCVIRGLSHAKKCLHVFLHEFLHVFLHSFLLHVIGRLVAIWLLLFSTVDESNDEYAEGDHSYNDACDREPVGGSSEAPRRLPVTRSSTVVSHHWTTTRKICSVAELFLIRSLNGSCPTFTTLSLVPLVLKMYFILQSRTSERKVH